MARETKMNGQRDSLAVEAAWQVFGDSIVEAELTGPERAALYGDILTVHDEVNGFVRDAAEVLKLRIGGAVNLRNYVNCLMAGIVRANLEATKETELEAGADYVLAEGESFWVSVGNASVHVQHGSDGVGVTLYPVNHEDEDSVTETWATWAEFEKEPV
jgi:hypothetical protein